ncbi:MAG: hypothetical protein JNK16_12725 [Phycisphaerales bacterium]|nr:hypothetical protein [Phycisphaerales bacterium]
MNIVAVIVGGYIAFSLELGLRNALAIGSGGAAPSFVFVLCMILAIGSPANLVLWTCLIFGLITDLTWPHEIKGGAASVTLVGPYALGYMIAGQFVLLLRSQIIKRNPFSLAFLCLFGFAVAQIMVVFIYTARSGYTSVIVWEPTHQLISRMVSALYTGVLGLLVGLVAGPISAALGLHQPAQRRHARPIY